MQYAVKGIDRHAAVTTLLVEAPSGDDAARMAEAQGLRVLGLRAQRSWSLLRREKFPVLLFSQELSTLLNAGLSLIDALESLAEKESAEQPRKLLDGLVRQLYEGKSFSQAPAQFPWVFPPLFIALVQSSEKTGAVGAALSRYVAYRTRMDEVRDKLISTSIYPLLLLIVGAGVLLFLVGYVVPRFSLVFEGMGSDLPWISQLLLDSGQFLSAHQQGVYSGLAIAVIGIALALRQPSVQQWLRRLVERIPPIRYRLFIYEMARFYRSLGILLQGGIPLLTAMEMAGSLLGPAARTRLQHAATRIREGQSLSQALEENRLATPVSLRMLRAGERSGNVGQMMERTADFFDEETGRWVEWFVRLFEPLLMAFIGIVIGTVVVLMYVPIFELASSIQ